MEDHDTKESERERARQEKRARKKERAVLSMCVCVCVKHKSKGYRAFESFKRVAFRGPRHLFTDNLPHEYAEGPHINLVCQIRAVQLLTGVWAHM